MTTKTIHCDSCKVLTINGIACHEYSCPNINQDPVTGEPYTNAKCCWCGHQCAPPRSRKPFCDRNCEDAYYN